MRHIASNLEVLARFRQSPLVLLGRSLSQNILACKQLERKTPTILKKGTIWHSMYSFGCATDQKCLYGPLRVPKRFLAPKRANFFDMSVFRSGRGSYCLRGHGHIGYRSICIKYNMPRIVLTHTRHYKYFNMEYGWRP